MHFNNEKASVVERANQIQLLLLDVDGVLTDGRLYFSNTGEEMKAFSTLDGHGIKMLQKAGIEAGIITGRSSRLLKQRASDLGIKLLYQGREDKLAVFREILSARKLQPEQVAYAGDDLPDLPVLLQTGLSFSVPGGHGDVRQRVHVVTTAPGGMGAVREITDFILQARNRYRDYLPT